MGKLAFVFSGQGAQYSGMGQDLYISNSAAKYIFDQAEAIRPGTLKQCFEGTKQELSETINTQPCLYSVGLAAAYSLKALGVKSDVTAGFSLGEIAALTYADVFDFPAGFDFVCHRARLMQEAGQKNPSAMVAVLKLTSGKIETLCSQYERAYPVNYNSNNQTVVALEKANLSDFCQAVQSYGGKALSLPVSGGFHSPFMTEAGNGLTDILKLIKVKGPSMPVYANKTALPYTVAIKETIAAQVTSPVYWQRSIENMINAGVDTFIEVGAGKTLCNLIKKINPEVKTLNVENQQSLEIAVSYCIERDENRRSAC